MLLHEMVHLYNLQNDIKDTSRGNGYHNKRFKEEAEKRSLNISCSPKIGWSDTKLNDEARQLVADKANATAFTLSRARAVDDGDMPAPKPKSSTRKYICPVCGAIIRSTKEVNVICGDCDVAFELAC